MLTLFQNPARRVAWPGTQHGITALLILGMTISLSACVAERWILEPSVPASEAIGGVSVTPAAMIMAVGSTRQLEPKATSLTGAPIAVDEFIYVLATASDSAFVDVSSTGLVRAKRVAPQVRVNVIGRTDKQLKAYQVLVQVTQQPVSGLTLSIRPADSTRLAAGSVRTMQGVVRNATTGQLIASPTVRYSVRPEDAARMAVYVPVITYAGTRLSVPVSPGGATPSPSQIVALAPEATVWVFGTTEAYGTLLRDSVLFTLTYPFTSMISTVKTVGAIQLTAPSIGPTSINFATAEITLAPGATVTFRNGVTAGDPLTITYTFDNPAAATAASPPSTVGGSTGNTTALTAGQQTNRRFLTPGAYTWTATAAGGPAPWDGQVLTGRLIIK